MSTPAVAPPPVAALTPEQLEPILHPEADREEFTLGGRSFGLRVLPYRWEREFRKHALPLLKEEFKPIERLIFAYATEQHLVERDLGITKEVLEAKAAADDYLVPAVAVICMAQDEAVLRATAEGRELALLELKQLETRYRVLIDYAVMPDNQSPRQYLRTVVERQMKKQRMVDVLGEELQASFVDFASLAGMKPDLLTLMRASMQPALQSAALATRAATTAANLPGTFTASSRTSTSPSSTITVVSAGGDSTAAEATTTASS